MSTSLYGEYRLYQQIKRYGRLYRKTNQEILRDHRFQVRASHLQRLDDISVPNAWKGLLARYSDTKVYIASSPSNRVHYSFAEDAEYLIKQIMFGNNPSSLTHPEEKELKELTIHLTSKPILLQAFFNEFTQNNPSGNKRILTSLLKNIKASDLFPTIYSKITELIKAKQEEKVLIESVELPPDDVIDLDLPIASSTPDIDFQPITIETLFNEVLNSISTGDTYRASHKLRKLTGLYTAEYDHECLSNALDSIRLDVKVPETGNEITLTYKDGHPIKIEDSNLWILKVKDLHCFFRPGDLKSDDFVVIDLVDPDMYIRLIDHVPENISSLTFIALGGEVFTGKAEDIKITARKNEITLDNTKRPYKNRNSRSLLASRTSLNNGAYVEQINKLNFEINEQIEKLKEQAKRIIDAVPGEIVSSSLEVLKTYCPETIELFQDGNNKTKLIESYLDLPETPFAEEINKYSELTSVFIEKRKKFPMTTIQKDDLLKILNSDISLEEKDIHLLKLILIYNIYETVEQLKKGLRFSNYHNEVNSRNNKEIDKEIDKEIKYREDKLKEIALAESPGFKALASKSHVVFKLSKELPDSTNDTHIRIASSDGVTISISPELADKALSKNFTNKVDFI